MVGKEVLEVQGETAGVTVSGPEEWGRFSGQYLVSQGIFYSLTTWDKDSKNIKKYS